MSVTSPSTWAVIRKIMIKVLQSWVGSFFSCSEIILYSLQVFFLFNVFFFSKLNNVLYTEVEPQLQQSNNMQQQKILLIRM